MYCGDSHVENDVLMHSQIHKAKAEKAREEKLKQEMDAKRAKTKAARERRQERITAKRNALTGEDEEPAGGQ